MGTVGLDCCLSIHLIPQSSDMRAYSLAHLQGCLFVSLSACPSVCLLAYQSVCLPVSLSAWPSLADCLSFVLLPLFCLLEIASIDIASAVLCNLLDTVGTLLG